MIVYLIFLFRIGAMFLIMFVVKNIFTYNYIKCFTSISFVFLDSDSLVQNKKVCSFHRPSAANVVWSRDW